MNTFPITSNLSDIYPDVQGELCSKHTVLLNQIQQKYRKAYPMYPPTHYVISKAVIPLARSAQASIMMGLEQGVTVLLSAGEYAGQISISGNFLQEQLDLTCTGKIISPQNQSCYSTPIRKMIELATEDLSLNKIKGGFLYIHCHDKIEKLSLKNSLLLAIFMSIITLNDLIEQYSQQELIQKLKSCQQLKTCDVESYFSSYRNRQFVVKKQNSKQVMNIKLQNKYKLVFINLEAINIPKQSYNNLLNLQEFEDIINSYQNQKMTIVDLFMKISQNQMKLLGNSICLQFIEKTIKHINKKPFIIVQDGYCVLLVESYFHAQTVGKISRNIHQMLSKNQNDNNNVFQSRNNSNISMYNILFSSVPSKAISILNPFECIWF